MLKPTHLLAFALILGLTGCAHNLGERVSDITTLPQTWTA
jgi:hypothetical protein